jgi:hypothetical protein
MNIYIYSSIHIIYIYIYNIHVWKNETNWFEVKWMQSEDIMLSEASQAQKYKSHMFCLISWR